MPILNMVGGGKKGGNIGEPLNLTVTTSGLDATIKWEDNGIGTIPPTTFQKSELVRKIGSAPTSPSDGVLVVTETVKDTYKTTGYVDQGLTDGETYYYRVFSYSDLGGISYCDAVSVTPSGGGWQPGVNTFAYYKFDGNLNDSSGNSYNMTVLKGSDSVLTYPTLTGTEKYCARGSGRLCTGTTFSSLDLDTWTVSGYYKIASNTFNVCWYMGGNSSSSQRGKGTGLIIKTGGVITIFVLDGDINTNATITSGTWHNIVMTQGSGQTKIYVDGQLADTVTQTYSKVDNIFRMFGNPYSGYDSVAMDYDEIIIEDKTRTAQEVADYFNQTKANYGIS